MQILSLPPLHSYNNALTQQKLKTNNPKVSISVVRSLINLSTSPHNPLLVILLLLFN